MRLLLSFIEVATNGETMVVDSDRERIRERKTVNGRKRAHMNRKHHIEIVSLFQVHRNFIACQFRLFAICRQRSISKRFNLDLCDFIAAFSRSAFL